ncbi:hypothetical protein ACGFZR_15145 [Streptomyces sp. NPDC048241]|uniref:hypothetical protein n=1 Tax=Streptomyces sp. NPDC048241 TaxID=3365521 RepID=UPI003711F1C8
MVAYPNPDKLEVHFAQLEEGNHLGDIWAAARAAGVKPGTIRVWVTRGKIAPILEGATGPVFHLPTIRQAAAGGAKHKPADPAANSRGPHRHAA